MEKEMVQFETLQHKMRVKRIGAATSHFQSSHFFKQKRLESIENGV
jgi:hypothetical protein